MLEFSWENLDEAIDQFVKDELEPMIRGLAAVTWNSIMVKTPQKYGRLVASWSYSINSPVFLDRSSSVVTKDEAAVEHVQDGVGKHELFYRGHRTAINVANSAAIGQDAAFTLGDTIWFANGADHGEGPYSAFIESVDSEYLRRYNRPGQAVARTLQNIDAKFGVEIPASVAAQLKMTKIGMA